MSYVMKLITPKSDRSDRKNFVNLMCKFRDEYFNRKPPYQYTLEHLSNLPNIAPDVKCGMIMNHNTPVGMFEFVKGRYGNLPIQACGTLFIQAKYRGQGITKQFYDLCQTQFDSKNIAFCVHIEESKFIGNEQKFIDLGFTSYYVIEQFTGNLQYKEKTYALFRKPYMKSFLPIKA